MEVPRLEACFSLNWIENGSKCVALRISSVNCITNSSCAVYQISPRNMLYRWWWKYHNYRLKKKYHYLQGCFQERSSNCMNFSSRKILKSLQHKNIAKLFVSNLTVRKHLYRQPCSDVVFDTAFPLSSSSLKLSGSYKKDKGLWETPSKTSQREVAVDYT